MLKRREFIKNASSISAIIGLMPSMGFNAILEDSMPGILQNFMLKGFHDEQEEYPSIVGDGQGNMWMYSLRRLKYPEDTEVISAFKYDGKSWLETDPITKIAGHYETPIASCAKGGKPVIAWTEKKEDIWQINAVVVRENKAAVPYTFPVKSGRSISPVLHSPTKDRNWIVWENLHDGKLTIYLSKYENEKWSAPVIIDKGNNSCFDPAIAEAKNGDLYIAYGVTHGYHQNIEMSIIDGKTLKIKKTIPVAIGGGHKNRVNINSKAALAFDALDRLWISYENNRNTHRLNDGDNYTGDRCCAILSYQKGKVVEIKGKSKWLFTGKNDHRPTFIKDNNDNLFMMTHCGGDFEGNPHWQYRLSWLDPQNGWAEPVTILKTKQKGALVPPTFTFDKNNNMWLATCIEKRFDDNNPEKPKDAVRSILSQLTALQISTPKLSKESTQIKFNKTTITEYLPDANSISQLSGHPKIINEKMKINGEEYTLVYGNLHEHTEISPCWPAGTDGTLHEDYRFGKFSEGYDFVGMTDHGGALSEVFWRRSLRYAEFYNEPGKFVAIPSMEWTLRSDPKIDGIQYGVGHYNVIFNSIEDSKKFIRNEHEIYSKYTPETDNSSKLWKLLHEKNIDCITIPHHPADETHPVDWNVHDEKYVPVVELFQCRGNSEYPGCPREFNVPRHTTTKHKRAFVNYALNEKKYKMGFIASGDHNGMGVGVAALWVKELTREGVMEAMKSKRCFATTGDKMIIDFRVDGQTTGSTIQTKHTPKLELNVKGQHELAKVEILRNSQVIKAYDIKGKALDFNEIYEDNNFKDENDGLYYYIRVTQHNAEIGWSSPIWIENS